jgi:hypothetical protein
MPGHTYNGGCRAIREHIEILPSLIDLIPKFHVDFTHYNS